jgi:hypothetical protein
MAAPSIAANPIGATDAGGAWTFTTGAAHTAGLGFILAILQDGTTTGAVTLGTCTNLENLAGTGNTLTTIVVDSACGSPTAGLLHIFIGRVVSTAVFTVAGGNSTSEDLYLLGTTFNNMATGTTLATVIENGTAGSTANGVGTGTTVSDTAVTTLGPDRLALNIVGGNDDPTGFNSDFTGETGGDWTQQGNFGSSTGTDGSVNQNAATITSAGTIDGGTYTVGTSFGWGCLGFALIGTTVVSTVPHKPIVALQGVNRGSVW